MIRSKENAYYLWYALIDRMAWIRFRLGQLDEAEQLATQAINLDKQEQAAPALASLAQHAGWHTLPAGRHPKRFLT
ncbi:MAG: hypothetical protein R2856_21300 [Caldilineaceae bacterium]